MSNPHVQDGDFDLPGDPWLICKKILIREMVNMRISLDSKVHPPSKVYELHPLFEKCPYKTFRTNLNTLRKSLVLDKERADEDRIAFEKDSSLHKLDPKEQKRRKARESLLKDIAAGRLKNETKKSIYNDPERPEYRDFLETQAAFDKFVYQVVVREQIESSYWKAVRSDKAKERGDVQANRYARKKAAKDKQAETEDKLADAVKALQLAQLDHSQDDSTNSS